MIKKRPRIILSDLEGGGRRNSDLSPTRFREKSKGAKGTSNFRLRVRRKDGPSAEGGWGKMIGAILPSRPVPKGPKTRSTEGPIGQEGSCAGGGYFKYNGALVRGGRTMGEKSKS